MPLVPEFMHYKKRKKKKAPMNEGIFYFHRHHSNSYCSIDCNWHCKRCHWQVFASRQVRVATAWDKACVSFLFHRLCILRLPVLTCWCLCCWFAVWLWKERQRVCATTCCLNGAACWIPKYGNFWGRDFSSYILHVAHWSMLGILIWTIWVTFLEEI